MTQNDINSSQDVLQIVSTSRTTILSCATVIPRDDSIPQNTEGDQVFTLAITPKRSTSKLKIFFSSFGTGAGGAVGPTVALFQDSTANALAAVNLRQVNSAVCLDLQYIMTSGTTSSTTFAIRVGPNAGTFYINGDATGTQLMGGVASTTMTIVEYRQ